jgi:hypothetical protein
MTKLDIIEKAINYFRSLPKNWDNFDSPEVSQQAINSFETIATRFFKFFYLRNSMSPVSGGGIQIDFCYDKKILTVEIYSNGDVGIEKFNNNLVPEHSVISIPNLDSVIVNELLAWLINEELD